MLVEACPTLRRGWWWEQGLAELVQADKVGGEYAREWGQDTGA